MGEFGVWGVGVTLTPLPILTQKHKHTHSIVTVLPFGSLSLFSGKTGQHKHLFGKSAAIVFLRRVTIFWVVEGNVIYNLSIITKCFFVCFLLLLLLFVVVVVFCGGVGGGGEFLRFGLTQRKHYSR